jgi:serine/threonine protein kinase
VSHSCWLPTQPRRAVEIAEQVCRGLGHAHELGVDHRDIKPANILIAETGEAKLTDFGIARAALSSTRAPRTSAAGTYAYLPPEQWEENLTVDKRSDIYAIGVTLFEMLVGAVPFPGNAVIEIHRQHQQDPVPPLPRNIRAPSGLGDVILYNLNPIDPVEVDSAGVRS